MTDSPIKVVNNLLPYDCFRKLAYFIMTIDSYRCHDYTVYETEADGSIDFYGEQNLNPKTGEPNETKFHEILFSTRLLFRDHNAEYIQDLYHRLRPEMEALYEALNVQKMLLLRANCTQRTDENYRSQWHTDLGSHPDEGVAKTAILYLNANNGGTKFKETGEFVQSAANRAVIFPEGMEHAGVWCTDKKLRFVLNINYTEKT
jgi:hypothetical protein